MQYWRIKNNGGYPLVYRAPPQLHLSLKELGRSFSEVPQVKHEVLATVASDTPSWMLGLLVHHPSY